MIKGMQFIFAFSLGAAVSAVATWKILKAKYERMINDEMDAFIEEYTGRKRYEGPEDAGEAAKVEQDSDISKYEATIKENNYGDYGEATTETSKRPYVIPPEMYGNKDGYDIESLNYYEGDKVLTDDWDNQIEDVENMVGIDFAEHFGEYEDDSVFVRNDRLKTDYEILLDKRSYAETRDEE